MNKEIQVTRASMPPFEEYCEEIKELWESHWLTHTGVKHQLLEKQLCSYFDVPCVELFSNGHMALELAIQALGLTGEIITTPFTFASTTQAILRSGLTPVFCEVEDSFYTMNPDKIEALITDKTSAILPVHVYGNICDYEAIGQIAKKHKLKVLYDAAHAFGEKVGTTNVAKLGDATMFSFHATKVFNTIEGGCIAFSDESLAKEYKAIRQFGMYGKEDAEQVGTNAKMTEFQAAMGICNLRHVEEYIERRRNCVEVYRRRLQDLPGVRLCPLQSNVLSNYAYFPVVFEPDICGVTRDEICEGLKKEHIFARKYFYPLTSEFSVCRQNYEIQATPIAKRISEQIVTLPLYSDLSTEETEKICDAVEKTLEEKGRRTKD